MPHLCFALGRFDHDMSRDKSSFALVIDSDAVLQTVKTRLLLHYEEWFLSLSSGLPYFTRILVKNPNLVDIESLIVREIALTDGVERVTSISLSLSPGNRSLGVDFTYTDIYGFTVRSSI